jgi:hypothetical protein
MIQDLKADSARWRAECRQYNIRSTSSSLTSVWIADQFVGRKVTTIPIRTEAARRMARHSGHQRLLAINKVGKEKGKIGLRKGRRDRKSYRKAGMSGTRTRTDINKSGHLLHSRTSRQGILVIHRIHHGLKRLRMIPGQRQWCLRAATTTQHHRKGSNTQAGTTERARPISLLEECQ